MFIRKTKKSDAPPSRIKPVYSIDLFKFIMACIVVDINTHPFEGYTSNLFLMAYNQFVNLAVHFSF